MQTHIHGCINSRRKVAVATKFCRLAPNISGSSIWNSLHVTLLVSGILTCVRFSFFHPYTGRPLRWTNTAPQTSTIISTLPYAQNPKQKTLTLLHSKECLYPALFSKFKTNDAEVLPGIRTVYLHRFADSLPACYAAGMNTNMKLVVTLQEWRHDLCCFSMVPSLIYLHRRMENIDDSVPFLQKYAYISQVINHFWGHLTARAGV